MRPVNLTKLSIHKRGGNIIPMRRTTLQIAISSTLALVYGGGMWGATRRMKFHLLVLLGLCFILGESWIQSKLFSPQASHLIDRRGLIAVHALKDHPLHPPIDPLAYVKVGRVSPSPSSSTASSSTSSTNSSNDSIASSSLTSDSPAISPTATTNTSTASSATSLSNTAYGVTSPVDSNAQETLASLLTTDPLFHSIQQMTQSQVDFFLYFTFRQFCEGYVIRFNLVSILTYVVLLMRGMTSFHISAFPWAYLGVLVFLFPYLMLWWWENGMQNDFIEKQLNSFVAWRKRLASDQLTREGEEMAKGLLLAQQQSVDLDVHSLYQDIFLYCQLQTLAQVNITQATEHVLALRTQLREQVKPNYPPPPPDEFLEEITRRTRHRNNTPKKNKRVKE
eukprot:scaffold222_cov176-Ochromonas_danica.AAC.6